jgi:hypothetical protein
MTALTPQSLNIPNPPIEIIPVYPAVMYGILISVGITLAAYGSISLFYKYRNKDRLVIKPREAFIRFAFLTFTIALIMPLCYNNIQLAKSLQSHGQAVEETKTLASNKIFEKYNLNEDNSDFKFPIVDSSIQSAETVYENPVTNEKHNLTFVFDDNGDPGLFLSKDVTDELVNELKK